MSWDELSGEFQRLKFDIVPFMNASQISGLNKRGPKYKHPGYQVDHPIIPHGVRYVTILAFACSWPFTICALVLPLQDLQVCFELSIEQ